ncbi:hypothetical protein [Neobacillus cucumis]|uniref:hypothetical protein n=1 Tax=Neobacillus cucumis TaxID=1740721 RepID=UPI002E234730|nr:hypothetical protein [Neobacillus cucumis]
MLTEYEHDSDKKAFVLVPTCPNDHLCVGQVGNWVLQTCPNGELIEQSRRYLYQNCPNGPLAELQQPINIAKHKKTG